MTSKLPGRTYGVLTGVAQSFLAGAASGAAMAVGVVGIILSVSRRDASTVLAWLFVVVVVPGIIGLICWRRSRLSPQSEPSQSEPSQSTCSQSESSDSKHDDKDAPRKKGYDRKDVYDDVEPDAHFVKAIIQMIIGVVTVLVVGWQFFHEVLLARSDGGHLINLLSQGIGVGLAAAAVVELAYTLFTRGPDEALDPLMLALSAAMLVQLADLHGLANKPESFTGKAGGLLILGTLLAALFGTRLFLAERQKEAEAPNVWWIKWKEPRHNGESTGSTGGSSPKPQ